MDNTGNYEPTVGETKELEGLEIVKAVPTLEDFIDEKCLFSAVAPSDAPAVMTWSNVSVATKPARGKQPKAIINNINGCISGGLWGIMGASGTFRRWNHYNSEIIKQLVH